MGYSLQTWICKLYATMSTPRLSHCRFECTQNVLDKLMAVPNMAILGSLGVEFLAFRHCTICSHISHCVTGVEASIPDAVRAVALLNTHAWWSHTQPNPNAGMVSPQSDDHSPNIHRYGTPVENSATVRRVARGWYGIKRCLIAKRYSFFFWSY